jgi:HPt (histidine-containing phosphotransfer) domain-containing protein
VAVTASALVTDEQRCREAGMDDYLRKPIDARELAAVLRRVPSASGIASGLRERLASVYRAEGSQQLMQALLEDFPGQRQRFEHALRAGNAAQVARVAHDFQSIAWLLGATGLAQSCAALEQAARSGETEQALRDAPAVLSQYQRLVMDVRAQTGA